MSIVTKQVLIEKKGFFEFNSMDSFHCTYGNIPIMSWLSCQKEIIKKFGMFAYVDDNVYKQMFKFFIKKIIVPLCSNEIVSCEATFTYDHSVFYENRLLGAVLHFEEKEWKIDKFCDSDKNNRVDVFYSYSNLSMEYLLSVSNFGDGSSNFIGATIINWIKNLSLESHLKYPNL